MLLSKEEDLYAYILGLDLSIGDGLLILIGELSDIDIDNIILKLNNIGIKFWGGIFPYVISDKRYYSNKIVVQVYPLIEEPFFIKKDTRPDLDSLINSNYYLSKKKPVLMIIVPGKSINTSDCLFNIFNKLGDSVNYIGAGAGSLSSSDMKCLFCNKGFSSDSYLLCFIDLDIELQISHGWTELSEPLLATKTDNGIITELNWLPALDVYKDIIKDYSKEELTTDNFYKLSQNYPLGIEKDYNNFIVRAILGKTNNKELVTTDLIDRNSILHVLKGNKDTLLSSSERTFRINRSIKNNHHSNIIFNCVSRLSILEDEFTDELTYISRSLDMSGLNSITEGAVSLGEISHTKKGNLDFYNITIVTAITSKH